MSSAKARVWAVVPAAGVGARMGADRPKQYLALSPDGVAPSTVLECTLDRLTACSAVSNVVVGINAEDAYFPGLGYQCPKPLMVSAGGKTRAHTVLNALNSIVDAGGKNDWALVHDAARPCVLPDEIDALLEVGMCASEGAILAVPMADTVKQADAENRAQATVPRDALWSAKTPQCFPVDALLQALSNALQAGADITDEASAMEWAGVRPKLVVCSADNIKITTPDDLLLAHLILKAQALN